MKLTVITTEFSNALVESGDLHGADLKDLFNTHPSVDRFYITSDGQAFFAENMADSHGQKLRVRDYIEVTRDQVINADGLTLDVPPAEQPPADQPPADVPPADQPPADVPPADQPPAGAPPADEAPKDALAIAFATPEAERTPYQKGLITKATKATEGGNN